MEKKVVMKLEELKVTFQEMIGYIKMFLTNGKRN